MSHRARASRRTPQAPSHATPPNYLTATELDTIGELETQIAGVNVLLSTEVDTEAELETLLTNVTDVLTENDSTTDLPE